MENWELVIKLFRVRVFESLLSSVPPRSFKEETVDINTLIWCIDCLSFDSSIVTLDDILQDLGSVDNLIKRPVLGFSLSSNLLLHGSEETLWVEDESVSSGEHISSPSCAEGIAIVTKVKKIGHTYFHQNRINLPQFKNNHQH